MHVANVKKMIMYVDLSDGKVSIPQQYAEYLYNACQITQRQIELVSWYPSDGVHS